VNCGSNRSGIGENVMSSKEIRLFFSGIDPSNKEDQLTFGNRIVRVGKFDPATTDQASSFASLKETLTWSRFGHRAHLAS